VDRVAVTSGQFPGAALTAVEAVGEAAVLH
jgi:hypothetical protein